LESAGYTECVVASHQTLTIVETPRPQRARKVLLLVLLFLPLVWYIGRRERDYQAAYSGVVVEKGMDYSLIFGGTTPDLYIVLRDELGKQSKRYICSRICTTEELKCWSNISVGSFIVKDKGSKRLPYQTGEKPPSRTVSNDKTDGWIFFGAAVVCAIALFIALRQFWQAL
jgi:hypothetical protein